MYLPAKTTTTLKTHVPVSINNENIVLAYFVMGFIVSSCIVDVIYMGFKPLLVKTHVNISFLENNTLETHAKTLKKHQNTHQTIKKQLKPMHIPATNQRKGADKRTKSCEFVHQRWGSMCPYALAQLCIARHERIETEINFPVRGSARAFSPPTSDI